MVNLVLVTADEVMDSGRVVLTGRRADHILHVLKKKKGQTLKVGVVNGKLGTGTIRELTTDSVTLDGVFDVEPPPELEFDLLLALPRPKVMKRLLVPLAALGVRRIFLTNAAKVERNYFDTHWIEPRHFEPLLIEGLEQAGDTRLPEVAVVRRLKPFIEDRLDELAPSGLRLVAHSGAGELSASPSPGGKRILLAVGPEGGWTEFELDLLEAHGFRRFSLGPRTLRTDHACIGLICVLRHALAR